MIALELNAGRAAGAARLTRRVRARGHGALGARRRSLRFPSPTASFDACISQEALLHIADKAARPARAVHRVLRPGGRLAFSDWIARPATRRPASGNACASGWPRRPCRPWTSYRALLGARGFAWAEAEDLTAEWAPILRGRLAMYRGLRDDTVARLGEARYREYDQLYAFFVGLIEDGKLGGGRFWAGPLTRARRV